MKVTILNGDIISINTEFSTFLSEISKESVEIEVLNLSEMKLTYCVGCWDCWWKTPGECRLQDDGSKVFRKVINSDLVVFASPLIAGFTTSLLKLIADRLITLLHPYIEIIEGECHHKKRYDKYPNFGLILEKENDTDEEDIEIINDIYNRFALNFHSKHIFTKSIDQYTPSNIL